MILATQRQMLTTYMFLKVNTFQTRRAIFVPVKNFKFYQNLSSILSVICVNIPIQKEVNNCFFYFDNKLYHFFMIRLNYSFITYVYIKHI